MTPAGLASLIRLRTKTDSTTFPDADMLIYVNMYIYEFAKLINDANEDFFGSISTTDLVADQREYTLPADLLNRIKAIECNFSDTEEKWIRLREMDVASVKKPTSETDILAFYSNEFNRCAYDLYRNSLFIYSGTIVDVTGGIKMYSFSEPDPLANLAGTSDLSLDLTATGHGLPKSFHELLARRVGMEFKSNAQQPIPLTEVEQAFRIDFELALKSIKGRNQDRSFMAQVPLINNMGTPTGDAVSSDNGYNY
jgi:hypothetical protein